MKVMERQSCWMDRDLLRELSLTNAVRGTAARLRFLPNPKEHGGAAARDGQR